MMRKDLYIYNEACGFSLHSKEMGGLSRRDLVLDLPGKVAEGWVIPVELVQDDSFHVRVVMGDLTQDEEEQWVARLEWKLRIPDGCLSIEGGLDPETRDTDDFVRFIEVPPGNYRVEIYTYLTGMNGRACREAMKSSKTLGEWFRRTRPNETMPDWLMHQISTYPREDPGLERNWEALAMTCESLALEKRVEENPTIDFLVRLSPFEHELPAPPANIDGWFHYAANVRMPELFPLGIMVEGIEPRRDEQIQWEPRSPEAAHLLESVPEAASPLGGGPLMLPLSSLHHLARIPAWLNAMVWAVVLLKPPGSGTIGIPGLSSTLYMGVEEHKGGLLLSLKPRDKLFIANQLRDIAPALKEMPDGTNLEIVFGDYSGFEPEGDHRYKGALERGYWTITHGYPEVHRKNLAEALEFAGCLDEGAVEARNTDEAENILKACRSFDFRWCDTIGLSREGNVLRLKMPDEGEFWNVARLAFAMRFSDIWPAWKWWDRFNTGKRPDGSQQQGVQ
jgi:hypothetical protein